MNKKIEAKKLNLFYGDKHALKDVDLAIEENKITAFIGHTDVESQHFKDIEQNE